MSVVAISSQTIAIIIVAVLFAQFLLLLGAALVRSRRAAAAGPAGLETAAAPAEPEAKPERKPRPVTRREFFRGSLLASLGLFAAEFGAATVAFVWPNLSGGFGGDVDTGLGPDDIKAQIRQDNQPFYLGAGRFYIVEYDGSGADTVYSGLIDGGLMALFQRCVHLGCRVPFCEQSQWFECPCHGSKYNIAGEYRDGPAPRGLDRFALRVEENTVVVDTSTIVLGPPRGTVTTQPEPDGPFCVTGGLEG